MHRGAHARQPAGGRTAQSGRIHWFILIGSLAALVHGAVVVALVARAGAQPLVANVAGWLVAFAVSFTGHHLATFRSHGTPVATSARRFFFISAAGFVLNESAYAALLRWTPYRYDILLAIVLVAIAFLTYQASRRWAFLGTAAR
jgi:putative flippase GtrA